MRGVKITGKRALEVCDWPDPEPKPGEVVVKIKAASICGSDLSDIYRTDGAYDVIPGHEAMGEVVAVDSPSHLQVGDRVMTLGVVPCGHCEWCREGELLFCTDAETAGGFGRNGSHAEMALVPERALLPLPDHVSDEAGACILDPIGAPYHALKRMHTNAQHTVGVFGVGPMGLGGVLVAAFLGAEVIAIEPIAFRRELALTIGAAHAVDPTARDVVEAIAELTGGRGLDMALECSGNARALYQALDAVRRKGAVSIIGENGEAVISPSNHFNRKEITLCGSTCFPMEDYAGILQTIERGLDPSRIITHRFGIEDAADAYAAFDQGDTGKVVLIPEG